MKSTMQHFKTYCRMHSLRKCPRRAYIALFPDVARASTDGQMPLSFIQAAMQFPKQLCKEWHYTSADFATSAQMSSAKRLALQHARSQQMHWAQHCQVCDVRDCAQHAAAQSHNISQSHMRSAASLLTVLLLQCFHAPHQC
jgi:hypothetical protein